MERKINYLESLQSVRGWAVILVVAFHSSMGIFDVGIFGVNMFFLLSGFVIYFSHSKDAGLKSAIEFFVKRFFRIYPVYIPILFLFVFMLFVSGKGIKDHFDFFVFFKNLLLIQDKSETIHPYAWTLAYEVFYYFCFCFFFIFLRKKIFFFVFFVFFVFFPFDANVGLLGSEHNLYFVAGVLLSCIYLGEQYMLVFLVSIFVSFLAFITSKFTVFFVFLGAAFFWAYIKGYKFFRLPCVANVGSASYSIYLAHGLTVPVFKNLGFTYNYFGILITFIFSVGLGFLYYNFFEKKVLIFFKKKYLTK